MAEPLFGAWTKKEAAAAIKEAQHPLAATNKLFVAGEMWQNGEGWVGPKPSEGSDTFEVAMSEIQRAFASANASVEIIDRHTNGVAGKEPHWYLTPIEDLVEGEEIPPSLQTAIDEAEAFLVAWWDKQKVHDILREIVKNALWSSRGPARLFVPRGLVEDFASGDGTISVPSSDPTVAFNLIHLEPISPEVATVYTDQDTKRDVGVLDIDDQDAVTGEKIKFTELVYQSEVLTLGEPPLTTILRIDEKGEAVAEVELGGRLTMAELKREPLMSRQVQEAQRGLNLALTMVNRNIIASGFLERVLLSAQAPGKFEEDEHGVKTFIPAPLNLGAGKTAIVQGIPITNPDGSTSMTTPSISYHEPSEITSSKAAAEVHYINILREADQLHILLNTEAGPSGKSRVEARADYESSLNITKASLEPLGRWLLETVLSLAETFMGVPGKWTSVLRVVFECRLDAGPLDVSERAQNSQDVKDGMLDRPSAMSRNGVTDPDATMAVIAQEPYARLDFLMKQALLFSELVKSMDEEAAATLAGFEPEQISLIKAHSGLDDQVQTGPDGQPILKMVRQ